MTSKPARAQDAGLSSSTAAVKRGGAPGGCARRTRSSTSSPMQQRSLSTAREAPIIPGRLPDEHERCSARRLGRCVLDPGRTPSNAFHIAAGRAVAGAVRDREGGDVNIAVSVIIATYERPQLLLRCVDALLAQTLPGARFEIVIVDDGSSRVTRERVITELGSRRHRHRAPTLRFLWLPVNRGPAAARNHGILAAQADVIAFTDDDTLPHPDWLRAGLAAIADGADAVAGAVEVPLPAVPTDYERDAAGLTHAGFVTANCFVRRALLAAVGGFDERFRCAWHGDTDLCFRLRASGAIVRASHAARVVHPVRPARWGVSLAQQRKVMFDALLYKKFPQGYRRHVRPRPPWDYYAAVAAGVCAVV